MYESNFFNAEIKCFCLVELQSYRKKWYRKIREYEDKSIS